MAQPPGPQSSSKEDMKETLSAKIDQVELAYGEPVFEDLIYTKKILWVVFQCIRHAH